MHVVEASLSGVRRYVVDLATGLHEFGLRQIVVYSPLRADRQMLEAVPKLRSLGVEVIELPIRRELRFREDVAAIRELRALLRRRRPRHLHLHSSKAGGVGRLAAVGVPRTVVVYTPQASAVNLGPAYVFLERVLGRLRTDLLIGASASERDQLASFHLVQDQQLAHIDNGVDVAEVLHASIQAPETSLPSVPFLVCSGRFAAQKDPLFMAEASARVLLRHPALHFVWVGDGELRAAFEERLAQLGIRQHWTITGWVSNPFPIVAASRFVIHSALYEGLSYATIEAMILGKPIVATDGTGTRDAIMPGVTGLLTPAGDVSAFADAIADLFDNPGAVDRMGAAARDRANRYTRSRMARETLDAYQRAR